MVASAQNKSRQFSPKIVQISGVVIRVTLEGQTKESSRREGQTKVRRSSIVWLSTICFYCVAKTVCFWKQLFPQTGDMSHLFW